MAVFVKNGAMPLSDAQLQARTQAMIDREWPQWKRERSLRSGDGEFDAYMDAWSPDDDQNRARNQFNQQVSGLQVALTDYHRLSALLEGEAIPVEVLGEKGPQPNPVRVQAEAEYAQC